MDSHDLAGDGFDSSEDEVSSQKLPPTGELKRTPTERHAFLFGHNLSPEHPDHHQFHPLPSQIPFLLDVFSENVNFTIQAVHLPTITSMIRDLRGDITRLTPVNEALMFSIYYAAITSMEEDDVSPPWHKIIFHTLTSSQQVINNFGSTKTELNLKYRLGLERALAKADFLNAPDIGLVQALVNFLTLARRHDSPRFVWMMTGIVIRMAQYLGLQRDGSNFKQLTPYEVELRRRVWWGVCMLDMRASEDQGTDLAIATGSFDTKIPLNINDADISPETKEMPEERDGLTDMSMARLQAGLLDTMRQLIAPVTGEGTANLEAKSRMLSEIYQNYEEGYLQYIPKIGNIAYWVAVTIARLVMAKMALIVFLPVLFASPGDLLSDEIRTKLLISAIEVAEYNHALNAEQECRQWRWIYQTYTHWHSIVYLMIEASRRPWSSIVERAYVALHSSWLIPPQASIDRSLRIWVPLRKLMNKVSKHRDAELARLRTDPEAALRLEMEDQQMPVPSSSSPLFDRSRSSAGFFQKRWRQLVDLTTVPKGIISTPRTFATGLADMSAGEVCSDIPTVEPLSTDTSDLIGSNMSFVPTLLGASNHQNTPPTAQYAPSDTSFGQTANSTNDVYSMPVNDWSRRGPMGLGGTPWLWADPAPSKEVSDVDTDFIDASMEFDGEVDWYNWVQSATSM
jgi:hypothetical protein